MQSSRSVWTVSKGRDFGGDLLNKSYRIGANATVTPTPLTSRQRRRKLRRRRWRTRRRLSGPNELVWWNWSASYSDCTRYLQIDFSTPANYDFSFHFLLKCNGYLEDSQIQMAALLVHCSSNICTKLYCFISVVEETRMCYYLDAHNIYEMLALCISGNFLVEFWPIM